MICPYCEEYEVDDIPLADCEGVCLKCQEYTIVEFKDELDVDSQL